MVALSLLSSTVSLQSESTKMLGSSCGGASSNELLDGQYHLQLAKKA